MKQFDRELELGFEVSAAQAIKIITREGLSILNQNIIHQTWLEEGKVGDYKFRTRIRRTEITYPDANGSWAGKCEYTTKYSKNDEKLKKIYEAAGKEEVMKIRTFLREPLSFSTLYVFDTYPNEEGDRARIEIEFSSKEEMYRWKAPAWLNELVGK